MSGALCRDAEEDAAARGTAAGPSATDASRRNVEELVLNQEQLAFEREISGRQDLARKANHSSDDEEAEEAREVAMDKNGPVIGLGPRGTGKTTVVTKAIKKASGMHLKTLVAFTTAQLASRMRTRLGQGGRGHAARGIQAESYPLMTPYDLVVIDELFQLDQVQFERILLLWRVADKVPALIFLSDKWVGATGRSD